MSPEQAFRGGASPELAELGLPGVNSIGVWVRDGLRDMLNPPGPKTGRGEVLNAGRDGGGGTARWRIAGAGVRAVLGVRGECKRAVELAQGTGRAVGVCSGLVGLCSEFATADCGCAAVEGRQAPFRPLQRSTVVLT